MIDISKLSEQEKKVVLARREYYRRWKKANADKVRANQERFYLRQAQQQKMKSGEKEEE